jgi:hypothetical protein
VTTKAIVAAWLATASLLSTSGPASAATYVPPTPARPTAGVHGTELPLCVTTIWRAQHTHHRKTRPGEICVLTPGMWLPHSWRVLAEGQIGDGPRYLIVERPRLGRVARPLALTRNWC